jgi:D-threonate/D-erythronate kinase
MEFAGQKIGIIADDLTGACDAIAPFASGRRPVPVQLEAPGSDNQPAEIVAYSTDTRGYDAEQAGQTVQRFAAPLARAGRRLIKKVDSTLLGHIATETNIILRELGDAAALIAPAFPAMGRCIVNGELFVEGEATDRRIPTLVREQLGVFCHTLTLDLLRGGSEVLNAAIQDQWNRGTRWFAVDAEFEEDLGILAGVIHASPLKLLAVGSGGLTRVLSRHSRFSSPPRQAAAAKREHGGPVVLFAGSLNPRTERQLARLANVDSVGCFDLNEDRVDAITQSFSRNGVIVVRVGWSDTARAALEAVVRACAAADVRGVIVTGGETASLICGAAGCTQLMIEGEVVAGVPFGRFGDGILSGASLVTKAGGFGGEEALVAACQYFDGR